MFIRVSMCCYCCFPNFIFILFLSVYKKNNIIIFFTFIKICLYACECIYIYICKNIINVKSKNEKKKNKRELWRI